MKFLKSLMALCFVLVALVGCGGGGDSGGEPAGTPQNPGTSPIPSGGQDSPGKIPGMGFVPGPLAGKPFVVPAGIKIPTTLQGMTGTIGSSVTENHTLTVRPSEAPSVTPMVWDFENGGLWTYETGFDKVVGSGMGSVIVKIPLENTTSSPKEMIFPAGLIFVSKSKSQNGILLKDVRVTIPAYSKLTVAMLAFCANEEMADSSASTFFEIGVITTSPTMNELIGLLRNKKINYEEYTNGYKYYWQIALDLQKIVANLTNAGIPLRDVHYNYIRNIPNSTP